LSSAFRQAFLLASYALGIVFSGMPGFWSVDAALLLVAVLLTEFSLRRLLDRKTE
jgi:hypothetical protein